MPIKAKVTSAEFDSLPEGTVLISIGRRPIPINKGIRKRWNGESELIS